MLAAGVYPKTSSGNLYDFEKFDAAEHREFRRNGVSKADEEAMSILRNDTFSMANLAVYVAHRVNGVAKIHTGILKDSLFRPAYAFAPEKFVNITNGITQRRWLQLCNEEFSALIDRKIGCGWRDNIGLLSELKNSETKIPLLRSLRRSKRKRKNNSPITFIAKKNPVAARRYRVCSGETTS